MFVVSFQSAEAKTFESVLELIRDAAEAGFLVMLEASPNTRKFRVHASLAAAYGFSYRGAYYSTPIILRELNEIRSLADAELFDQTVKRIAQRLAGWAESPLFDRLPNGN